MSIVSVGRNSPSESRNSAVTISGKRRSDSSIRANYLKTIIADGCLETYLACDRSVLLVAFISIAFKYLDHIQSVGQNAKGASPYLKRFIPNPI